MISYHFRILKHTCYFFSEVYSHDKLILFPSINLQNTAGSDSNYFTELSADTASSGKSAFTPQDCVEFSPGSCNIL